METPDTVARAASARHAYERAHVVAGARGIAIAVAVYACAAALHEVDAAAQLAAGALAVTLAVLGWRGGAWRRGSLAGVLAGVPPLIAPSVVFVLAHGGHVAPCPACDGAPTLACLLTCFGTSAVVGLLVGHRASQDRAPRRFAIAALAAAALTGTLACATTGLGGALGIAIGLVAGGATGWVFADAGRSRA
jgi:hypothetical protein|nr:hypothetical protein [Kofleriaceae bacterium]